MPGEKYLPKLVLGVDILLKRNTQPAMLNYAILMFLDGILSQFKEGCSSAFCIEKQSISV